MISYVHEFSGLRVWLEKSIGMRNRLHNIAVLCLLRQLFRCKLFEDFYGLFRLKLHNPTIAPIPD
jgi:hypothetical protein